LVDNGPFPAVAPQEGRSCTRHAFNDLRDQNGLGDRFFNKTRVSKLLRVMDELEAVDKWRATLTEKQRFEWASPDAITAPDFQLEQRQRRPSPSGGDRKGNAARDLDQEASGDGAGQTIIDRAAQAKWGVVREEGVAGSNPSTPTNT
jgi:hypothetical protein